jgi:DNA polymerase
MGDRAETAALAAVESLTGWWTLAGVDSAVGDETVNWLAADEVTNPARPPITANNSATNVPVAPHPWPSDIATLRQMVRDGAPLPGNDLGPVHIPPIGPENSAIVIISDLPDLADADEATAGTSAVHILLERMLAAIGINISDCYRTWLATTVPATGELPDHILPELGLYMRHQLGLIKPTSVILLGSSACKALLDADLMNARAELRNVNHDGRNIAALTTFHPRTLIARPAMKAQAWRDLQMFAKRDAL